MKELFFEMFKGLVLGMCFVLFCFVIATLSRSAYAVDLSNSLSDSSHRKSDFFVPKFCKASQAVQKTSASVSATPTRLSINTSFRRSSTICLVTPFFSIT